MKNSILLAIIALLLQQTVISQPNSYPDSINSLLNVNGAILPSPFFFDNIPVMEMTTKSDSTQLQVKVYNNEHSFFPPIFFQQGGSCVQSAEIGYCFTYEINRARSVSAGDWEQNKNNCYHPLFTYNFLNEGTAYTGTDYTSGFRILKETGCPSLSDFYDPIIDSPSNLDKFKYWMTGRTKYVNSMPNKIFDYYVIHFNYTYSSLNPLKHWLSDHGEGDIIGGVAIMGVYTSGWNPFGQIPNDSPEEPGLQMVSSWGSSTGNGHALTIVGYNDNIWCFDINNDGLYTFDQDVNGDSIVDLHDCEKGAFKVANSSGESWANDGYIFVPYKLMVEGLQSGYSAYSCKVHNDYQPEIIVNTNLDHIKRSKMCIKVGYSNSADQLLPIADTSFRIFNYQGGEFDLHAPYSDTIDIALDFGYHYLNSDFGKIFLIIESESDVCSSYGDIHSLSVIDYRWGEEFEIDCDQTNIPIISGTQTFLAIDYDLIPHESPITSDLLLYSDMVSRFNPTVTNNSTLTVSDVNIDMYNSTITIKNGSEMLINDGAVFRAKQGTCRIEIEGDIQVGDNVHFVADPGAILEIVCSNPTKSLDISNCEFENCTVTSSTHIVSIINSNFVNSNIFCENGNKDSQAATILNNTFVDGTKIAIDLYSFENFSIEQNTINNMKCGIMLTTCGDGVPGNQTIANNEIIDCINEGIHLYESVAYISENLVSLCDEGVRLENKSTTCIYGNPNATSYSQMNRFYNEDSYELYISKYSFPWYFHYNAIIDNDNGGNTQNDPLLYYDNGNDINPFTPKNVEYNCWGTGFSAQDDLFPLNGFDYNPTYCPPLPPSQSSPVETLYQNSLDQFTAEDYADSKAGFMFIVDQYPETKYAQSAMCELVPLEKYADNDYLALQNYFLTNTTIQSDTILAPLASKLANECDIELQNYTEAVSYFEGVIADPADTQDSIYAIIDLGYLYETMGSGNKASVVGKMPQYKPKSIKQFNKYKLDLLSLLPVKKGTQTGQNEVDILEENGFSFRPNPVNEITTFGYKLKSEGSVQVKIFATDGTPIQILDEGFQNKGSHEVTYNSSSLDVGIYYCSLVVDGEVVETRKMVVVR